MVEKLVWSHTIPKTEGYYWVRNPDVEAKVTFFSSRDLGTFYRSSVEWAGPIKFPRDIHDNTVKTLAKEE